MPPNNMGKIRNLRSRTFFWFSKILNSIKGVKNEIDDNKLLLIAYYSIFDGEKYAVDSAKFPTRSKTGLWSS